MQLSVEEETTHRANETLQAPWKARSLQNQGLHSVEVIGLSIPETAPCAN
jgi:hypothetical protein